MYLGHILTQYRVSAFIVSGLLLFGNLSVSHALSLNILPVQLESSSSIPLKKPTELKQQRMLFLQAETALKLGRYTQYQKLEHRLIDYPLYPYLRFIELEQRIKYSSTQRIQDFLQTYHNTPLANKLYYRWINSLARTGRSKALVQYFRPTQNTHLLCHYANALHITGEKGAAFSLTGELWQTGKSLPKSCDPILKKWRQAGYMTSSRLWARIHLVMNKGKRRLATYIGKSLPENERFWLSLWKKNKLQKVTRKRLSKS